MRLLKSSILLSVSLISILLSTCWSILIWLIDHIDGGDVENFQTEDSTINYNFRTGDVDPVKRVDGIYND